MKQLAQLLHRLAPDVFDTGEAANRRSPLADIFANQQGDVDQFAHHQYKRVCPGQEDPMRTRLIRMNHPQVLLYLAQRGEAELVCAIEGAELTAMPGTTRSDLQQLRCGFIRRPPHGAIKMQCRIHIYFFSEDAK